MSIPHLFQIKNFSNFDEISDFFDFLYQKIQEEPKKFTEKLDGIYFAVQKTDQKWFFVDKFQKKWSLFDILQSKWPEHLKTKFAKLLRKISKQLETRYSTFFNNFEEHKFVFEYLNKKQNVIEYEKECFVLLYVENEKTKEKFNVSELFREDETPHISQIFDPSESEGYYPANEASDTQKLVRISQIFDLPGHSWAPGLGSLGIKEWATRLTEGENKFENKLFEFYLENCNNFINNVQFKYNFGKEKEGIVVSGLEDFPDFKIVGDFMMKNLLEQNKFGTRFYLLAGMKPPHKGHLFLIKEAIKKAKKYNSKLVIFLTESKRDDFELKTSLEILNLYINNEGLDWGLLEIKVVSEGNKSFDAMLEEIKMLGEGSVVHLVSSDVDQERTREQVYYLQKNVQNINFELFSIPSMKYNSTNRKISSTDMRQYINSGNYDLFSEFVPDSSKKDLETIWNKLKNKTTEKKTFLPIMIS